MDAMCLGSGHGDHDMVRLFYQYHLRPASPAAHCTKIVSMQTFAATFYGLLETGSACNHPPKLLSIVFGATYQESKLQRRVLMF